ncbi:alanine racemase [candidate division FCPU426 bacterium]|nr:alanine racemase [candidate division FCPU426 bacterium]
MIPAGVGRPTWAAIDLPALRWNVRQVRKCINRQVRILAVVKANAYGHGAGACARALAEAGVEELGVATLEEARELRLAGIRQPVVVFGLVQPHEAEGVLEQNVQATVVDDIQLKALSAAARKMRKQVQVHVKVDTGMGRIGLEPQAVGPLVRRLRTRAGVKLRGLYTHFAHADGCNPQLLRLQMTRLQQAQSAVAAEGYGAVIAHAANSAAVIGEKKTHMDMVRPGLMLYGLYPAAHLRKKVLLKPVLSWHTRIIQVKKVPAGAGLSYGHTFVTRRCSRIATLPVGYADGFARAFSNRGRVLVRGKMCPVVGRVCMDMCLIDVSAIPGVSAGEPVVLLGRQQEKEISADDLARSLQTISYEVVCAIGSRVPRVAQGGS